MRRMTFKPAGTREKQVITAKRGMTFESADDIKAERATVKEAPKRARKKSKRRRVARKA